MPEARSQGVVAQDEGRNTRRLTDSRFEPRSEITCGLATAMSLRVGEEGVQTADAKEELALSGLTREPQLTVSCRVHRLTIYLHCGKCTLVY